MTIQPTKFDQLFDAAVPLVSAGRHQRDSPPVEGGRWPVSVVLRPPADTDLIHRLDEITAEAAALAGPDHWQTGQAGSAHLTVRALETYRSEVECTEPVIQRYQSAMHRASAQSGPAQIPPDSNRRVVRLCWRWAGTFRSRDPPLACCPGRFWCFGIRMYLSGGG
jgi:hypothetical protein